MPHFGAYALKSPLNMLVAACSDFVTSLVTYFLREVKDNERRLWYDSVTVLRASLNAPSWKEPSHTS